MPAWFPQNATSQDAPPSTPPSELSASVAQLHTRGKNRREALSWHRHIPFCSAVINRCRSSSTRWRPNPRSPELGVRGENSQRLRPRTTVRTDKSVLFGPPLGKIESNFVNVTPAPIFSGLERSHDGMSGRAEVFRGVFILGGIATTDVPAVQAQTKVHPPIALLQTLLTTPSARFDILDLIEMCAVTHCFPPVGCCSGSRT